MDHSGIFDAMAELGREASISQLVALMKWLPSDPDSRSNGFAVKWHVVGKRWEEVLGYRPEVVRWICDRNAESVWSSAAYAILTTVMAADEATTCAHCGNPVTDAEHIDDEGSEWFCSDKCRSQHEEAAAVANA